MVVKIVGTTSMTLLLAPTLELDVANVAVCLGDFYQGLLGCDLLCGHNEALVHSHHHLAQAGLTRCH